MSFAAEMLKLDLTPDKRRLLMDAYLVLKAWPDVPPALESLGSAGFRLAFLSIAMKQQHDAAPQAVRVWFDGSPLFCFLRLRL